MNTQNDPYRKTIHRESIGYFIQFALVLSLGLSALTGHAVAQPPPKEEPPAKEEVAEARSASSSASAAPPTSAAPQENIGWGAMIFKSTMEIGYRWRDFDGNEDVYRSQVNLGNGVKLLHSSSELSAPESSGVLFDKLTVNFDNWGGDPYNTTEVRVKKNLWYDFDYRYQKIDYFNFVPQFANPFFNAAVAANIGARQASGVLLGQHSFDTTRRMSNARLDIFPDAERFQLHFGYGHNSQLGPAFISENLGGDEFLLRRNVKNGVNDVRLGFEWRFWKLAISFEQAFRHFKNDEGEIVPGGFSIGNDPGELFGFQQLFIDGYHRSYFTRGNIPATRFAISSYKIPRVVFTARFYYSDADVDFDYSRAFTGAVFPRDIGSLATSGLSISHADASKPYTVADGTFRVNVTQRFAVMDTFRGSHFVIAGAGLLREHFTDDIDMTDPIDRTEAPYERTFLNSFMNQFEGEYALTNNFIVRAGIRSHHRRAIFREQLALSDSFGSNLIRTIRNERDVQNVSTLLLGGSYRLRRTIRVAVDYENGGYLSEFLDTNLIDIHPRDSQRGRVRVQFRPNDQWLFTAFGTLSDETRPSRTLDIVLRPLTDQDRSRSAGFSASWFASERIAVDMDYTRGHISAKIRTIDVRSRPPGAMRPLIVYLEDSNIFHAGMDLNVYKEFRLAFGYRVVSSSGSYPITFHRPYAHVAIPLHRVVSLNLDYQNYGYNEPGRSVQDYRANLLTTSLKFSF
jgi:hypothetical protein